MLETADMFEHKRARLRLDEVLTSVSYKRSSTRDSSHILMDFLGTGAHIGRVSRYLRIVAAGDDGVVHTLRIALVDFYKPHASYRDSDIGDPIYKATVHSDPARMFSHLEYAVDARAINTKVALCQQRTSRVRQLLFVPYRFRSKLF